MQVYVWSFCRAWGFGTLVIIIIIIYYYHYYCYVGFGGLKNYLVSILDNGKCANGCTGFSKYLLYIDMFTGGIERRTAYCSLF